MKVFINSLVENSSEKRQNPYMSSSSLSPSDDDSVSIRKVYRSRSRSRSRSHSPKKEREDGAQHHSKDSSPVDQRRKSSIEGSKRSNIIKPGLNGPLFTYKRFLDLQKGPVDNNEAEKCYNEYKNDHMRKQNEIFFHMHKVNSYLIYRMIIGLKRNIIHMKIIDGK